MKKRFPELAVVFISKDASLEKWKRSMDSWQIKDMGRHFHLDPQAKLAKIVAEPSIPRATLISKKGEIITIDADEPDSEKINHMIKQLSAE